ncbi:ricin-type beta-trefoil lectin domain protein [Actinoplanes sp. NPDC049681]|uniref:ricin-type beta-trefoil lectin domain protein n=1 Tax=Actinoplanes sp. NPDC049681 TaxID=3363905 RepID=UPI0037B6169C
MRNPFRRPGRGDEGSMPMAMLVSMVAMGMSATLVPVVVTQYTTTRVVDARTVSLDGAQAGIDVALAHLRAAGSPGKDADGNAVVLGKLADLPPCNLTGSQDTGGLQDTSSATATLRYRVSIKYFGIVGTATTATELPCPPTAVPKYAVLKAVGGRGATVPDFGDPGTRTIEATYTFKTNNKNIVGGQIPLASPTSPTQLCMDAGLNNTPKAGDIAWAQPCVDGGSDDQRFAYTADLYLQVVNPDAAATSTGMCLDAPLPHVNNTPIKFQPCLSPRAARQQWSLDNNGNFQGTSDGVNLDGYCINVQTAGTASQLVVGGCGGVSNKNVFRPEAAAGAGMASAKTNQLVNYKQFSRCLDVTYFDATYSYMIVWYCKQAPDGAVGWNQQWTIPAISFDPKNPVTGLIKTAGTGNPNACLKSPGNTTGYVTMSPCSMATTKNYQWTVFGDTNDSTLDYVIRDSFGYCLTPTALSGPNKDTHVDGTAKVKMAACNGDELQAWNAPPAYNEPLALTETKELVITKTK